MLQEIERAKCRTLYSYCIRCMCHIMYELSPLSKVGILEASLTDDISKRESCIAISTQFARVSLNKKISTLACLSYTDSLFLKLQVAFFDILEGFGRLLALNSVLLHMTIRCIRQYMHHILAATAYQRPRFSWFKHCIPLSSIDRQCY
jgi:hypothetical protein